MDDFNAKKDRARKLRHDKHRDKPKKHAHSSCPAGNVDSKSLPGNASTQKTANTIQHVTETETETDDYLKSFSKRKLVNNWDRYNEPIANRLEDDVDVGAHFEELMSMPISAGGHLMLKREHEWEQEKSQLQMPWFQLDVLSVEQNLSTILFSTRQDLPKSIFSEAQLQRMAVRAQRNAASLAEVNASILKVQNMSVRQGPNSQNINESKAVKEDSLQHILTSDPHQNTLETENSECVENQDLDSILALHETTSKSTLGSTEPVVCDLKEGDPIPDEERHSVETSKQMATSPTTDAHSQHTVSLDDWLDSILDD